VLSYENKESVKIPKG